ncbi:MAG: YbaY family lipoprotein [Chloroflexi bacterium]|nr:YbaY family lipoprotein [Chloroflexota bacterium]
MTGTVTYREKISLRPNAEVHVSLFDLSEFDALHTVLGEQKFVTGGRQVPLPFEITYDSASVDRKLKYAVRATIIVEGRPSFTSVERYLVIMGGRPSFASIDLRAVSALTGEFQELRKVKGHWQGGGLNPEVYSPRGRMRQVRSAGRNPGLAPSYER